MVYSLIFKLCSWQFLKETRNNILQTVAADNEFELLLSSAETPTDYFLTYNFFLQLHNAFEYVKYVTTNLL